MKDLRKLHSSDKFHRYSICGCQVKNSQSFAQEITIHAGPILEGFLGLYFPKYGPSLLKISRQKQCLQNLWKFCIFTRTVRIQNLHFCSNFEPPLSLEDGRNRKNIYIFSRNKLKEGYLRYKTILCHKVALNM